MEHSLEESLRAWEANAEYWDQFMGDESNAFHREVVRPKVDELLAVESGDFILEVACGNGNYAAHLAERGAEVVAFDYSEKMIELARKRREKYCDRVEFCVADASNLDRLMALQRERAFTKVVSNMAIMDIAEIAPLFAGVNRLLADGGSFVFATQHPCFMTLTEKYKTAHSYYGTAIEGQPREHCYYHCSMEEIFNLCFKNGFIIDGFYEQYFCRKEMPDIMIVRARKVMNMEFSKTELQEAKRQIDSTLHKLREALKTLESKENTGRYKSQITLTQRRITAFEIANCLIEKELEKE